MECPNCINSFKYITPHLEWMSDIHCKCEYGYFISKENNHWAFLPFEQEFDTDILLSIINTLSILNERSI